MINEIEVIEASKTCISISEISRKMDICNNTRNRDKISKILKDHNIKLKGYKTLTKYRIVSLRCPVCEKEFETQENHPRQKTTCSHACANTYFRSGENNPNYREEVSSTYRQLALRHYKKVCNKCGYCKIPEILQVHHIDRNRRNGVLSNLEVLCPNCHQEEHFKNNDGLWALTKKVQNAAN